MTHRASRDEFASAFGQALDRQLTRKGLGQNELAVATGASPSYINRLMRGRKVSPEWADKVSDVLDLTPDDRSSLHAAAAVTWGFKLDLTPEPRKDGADKKPSEANDE